MLHTAVSGTVRSWQDLPYAYESTTHLLLYERSQIATPSVSATRAHFELTYRAVISLKPHLTDAVSVIARTSADAVLATPVWTLRQRTRQQQQENQPEAGSEAMTLQGTQALTRRESER